MPKHDAMIPASNARRSETEVNSRRSVFCFGPLDRRAPAGNANVRRPGTPLCAPRFGQSAAVTSTGALGGSGAQAARGAV